MSVYTDGAGNVNASPRTNTPPVDPNAPIDPVVEILGGGRIVAHRPDLALAVGSTTAGLLLSQFWFWSNSPTAKARDGWFYMTADEISDQTGMSRNEQVTARKVLLRLGLIEEDKRGVPMKIWFHVKRIDFSLCCVSTQKRKAILRKNRKDEHTEKQEDDLAEKSNDDKTASHLAEKPKDRFRELRKIARGKTKTHLAEKPKDITDIPAETSSPTSLSSPDEADPEGFENKEEEKTKPDSVASDAVLLWDAALVELAERVNKPTFETHLRGLKPITFEDAILTLSAPSPFVRNWVETRHLGLIEEVAGTLACEAVSVRFMTAQGELAMPDVPLLTLSDVLKSIGWTEAKDRSAMNRYVAIDEVDKLLGATGAGRHTRYPDTHLWLFRDLAAAHERGEITPKSAAPYLRERIEAGPAIDAAFTVEGDDSDIRLSEHSDARTMALAPITNQIERMAAAVADTFIDKVRASGIVPPPEDRLISREEAAEILGLSDRPQVVSRRVPPVLPGQWSRVQILRYIEQLRIAAEEKAIAKKSRRRK